MSDDSTSGWMPPQQPEPSGSNVPEPPDATMSASASSDALPPPPLIPPSRLIPPSPLIPPPPPAAPQGWSAAGDEPAGDGPIGERSGSSKKVLIGAVVGVLAIGAAGVFAVTQMSDSNTGGAESPEELGEAFMEALDQEDVLGVIDLLLPGERATFSEPVQEMISELTRLEVLSEDASLDDLSGVDVLLEDRSVQVAGTNVDDIVNITMLADVTATVEGEDLPIGELISDALGDDVEMSELSSTESGLVFELPLTVVEEDGRWYASYFYTVAEDARPEGTDIPETGIEPKGGETPEGALDTFFDGVAQLDLTAMIAALNPNEAQALQRYAPLFIGDAQAVLDDAPFDLAVTDVEYGVEGDGSTRSVTIGRIRVEGQFDEQGESVSFSAEFENGCIVAETEGESFETCAIKGDGDDLTEFLGAIDGLDGFRAEFESILEDYDQPGITVDEVDGQWYISPIGTSFDQFFAITNALDPGEIQRAIEASESVFSSAEEVIVGEYDDLSGDAEDVPASTIVVGEEPPGDTVVETGDTIPSDDALSEADALYQECVTLPTAAEAAACMQGHVDSGAMPDYYMPMELKYLECGVGDVVLGIVPEYELSDEEYTKILITANTCFTDLIARGVVEDFEVPAEYMRPECAEGRNPWSFDAPDNQELFDRWLDCIYA